MSHAFPRTVYAMGAGLLLLLSTIAPTPSRAGEAAGLPDIGVDRARLDPRVTNPYAAFNTLKRAVYAGKERDSETGRSSRIRMEVTVRDTVEMLAGVGATVVDVVQYADDELVERARDYYAQGEPGDVLCIGGRVDDYEGGTIVGHEGEWVAGEGASRAGLFMPAAPKVGDVFEQERAPGIVQSRSKVIATARTVKVPAGTFKDCIETEHYDPIEKVTQRKWYCQGVGLVKESSTDRTIELTLRESR